MEIGQSETLLSYYYLCFVPSYKIQQAKAWWQTSFFLFLINIATVLMDPKEFSYNLHFKLPVFPV